MSAPEEAAIAAALAAMEPAERASLMEAMRRFAMTEAERAMQERLEAAKDDLIAYAEATMPDRSSAGAVVSRYRPARHHRALGAAMGKVDTGEWPNLIITMPPRHGKSELAVKRMAPWFIGRNPYRQVMFGTYSDDLAGDTGREIRETLRSAEHTAIFPNCELRKGSQSADRIQTTYGGGVLLAGRGGAFNGRGADLAIIDDPIKGREEAESRAIRKRVWDWFQDDIRTRLLSEGGRIVIIMTRWHEDDLIGRLIDPRNAEYSEAEAANWRILDLPALAREGDLLNRAPGDALWPERFGREYLEAIQKRNPRGFSSLYQCRPSAEDGDEFKAAGMTEYKSMADLPRTLRMYGASDHAVSTGQKNDRTCVGCGGLDEDGILWIMPDINWGRFPPDVTVDHMIAQMHRHKPMQWWAENEHISKSIGPFLRKRMIEEGAHTVVTPSSSATDNVSRAQSIRGLMALNRVRFPAFAPWWQDAKDEMLKFPNGSHDDFVSFMSHLGRGVDRMIGAKRPAEDKAPEKRGTMAWFKALAMRKQNNLARSAFKGW